MKIKGIICLLLAIVIAAQTPAAALAATTAPEQTTSSANPGRDPFDPSGEDGGEEPGTEEEPDFIKGDADLDGAVTAADARKVLRAAVDLELLDSQIIKTCDINDDKEITAYDARVILRFAVGLPEFETEEEIAAREAARQRYLERTNSLLKLYEKVSREEVLTDISYLVNTLDSRHYSTPQNARAARWLSGKLSSYGYAAENISIAPFTYEGISSQNVMATIPTAVSDPDIYLFCAHFDTASTTGGAIDNSSGVTIMLQLAKLLVQTEMDFGAEIRILFPSAEEIGYVGCYEYLLAQSASELSRHKFVYNVDMATRPNNGGKWFLCVSTEPKQSNYHGYPAYPNIGSDAVEEAKKELGDLGEYKFMCPVAAGMTDIVPFRRRGIDALTLSWREISPERSHGSDYDLAPSAVIHTYYDNVQNSDMTALYNTARLLVHSAAILLSDIGR